MIKYSFTMFIVLIGISIVGCVDNYKQEPLDSDREECVFDSISGLKICSTYVDDTLVSIVNYNDSLLDGRYIDYFTNGRIKMEGSYLNDNKRGYFRYFREDGTLKSIKHYAYDFFLDKHFMDQIISYDNHENVIISESYFVNILSNDTLTFGEPFKAIIVLEVPYYNSRMRAYLGVVDENLENLKEVNFVKYVGSNDTILYDYNRFESAGEYRLMGYIEDYKDSISGSDTFAITRRIVVNNNIYVKEH